jgi:hypothetical protein
MGQLLHMEDNLYRLRRTNDQVLNLEDYHFDMYMSKAAFISNDLGNLANFTALYVMSQWGVIVRYWYVSEGLENLTLARAT